ncbi:Aste57867_13198 [Aphanomyces stellatus]|uniref:Aste57867_13198 protein n=1 Tax=Aphanomyces stellatus TaxID=120398 RepID=A0A485KXH1_9STRA|nr:hypothetical protein As57867_013149 [Aphanomyces stellatus]VFT90038.1 Aste57867_13198 [Aphanomyces stellatus]
MLSMTASVKSADVTPTHRDEPNDTHFASPAKSMMSRKKCSHCASGFVVLSGSEGSSFCSSDCRAMDVYLKSSRQTLSPADNSDEEDEEADFVMIDQTQYGMRLRRVPGGQRRMSNPVAIPERTFQFVDECVDSLQ